MMMMMMMWYKNIAGRFFGLVTKHACDVGQNYDSQDRASIAASRGKNPVQIYSTLNGLKMFTSCFLCSPQYNTRKYRYWESSSLRQNTIQRISRMFVNFLDVVWMDRIIPIISLTVHCVMIQATVACLDRDPSHALTDNRHSSLMYVTFDHEFITVQA